MICVLINMAVVVDMALNLQHSHAHSLMLFYWGLG